jgi:hypothetical protein
MASRFASFSDFYPYYLSQHSERWCRRLHVCGTALGALLILGAVATGRLRWLIAVPFISYGLAWAGHYFFERNRPATFTHPWYSLRGDLRMFADICTGRLRA